MLISDTFLNYDITNYMMVNMIVRKELGFTVSREKTQGSLFNIESLRDINLRSD